MSRRPMAHKADRLRDDVVALLWFLAFCGVFVGLTAVGG